MISPHKSTSWDVDFESLMQIEINGILQIIINWCMPVRFRSKSTLSLESRERDSVVDDDE